jgi:transcriptional antiterminator NusG
MSEAAASNDIQPTADAAAEAPKGKAKRWYIIHAYSGFEKKVAQSILEQAAQKGLTDAFEQVVVPTEDVVEVRRGKKVQAERKFFPGYVLAKMDMNDATWTLVKNTDKVTGFLGGRGIRPQPITEAEAAQIFKQAEEGAKSVRTTIIFDIGEQVKIIDGPFESFVGTVEDVEEDRQKLKVSVSIFGRATPVELAFDQVHKVNG